MTVIRIYNKRPVVAEKIEETMMSGPYPVLVRMISEGAAPVTAAEIEQITARIHKELGPADCRIESESAELVRPMSITLAAAAIGLSCRSRHFKRIAGRSRRKLHPAF